MNHFDPPATPNPWFVWNGHDDGPTEYTRRYINQRRCGAVRETAITTLGGLLSPITVVNIPSVLSDGKGAAAASAQLFRLEAVARSFEGSTTISVWLSLVRALKTQQLVSRSAAVARAFVPLGPAIDGVMSVSSKVFSMSLKNVCLATAAEIHWYAFRELSLAKPSKGGVGPGVRMFFELFGANHDIAKFIFEPNGWMAVNEALRGI
ncbi:MAG TPA: hypothetical protein VM580_23525 [Labilithrix sp.]|nr:hypothetical protein [Labilithrix sp.]